MSDFYDDYDDPFGLKESEPDEDPEFKLVDIIGVDRVLHRIKKLRHRSADVDSFAREKISRVKKWASAEEEKIQEKIIFLETQIFTFLKQKEELGEETIVRTDEGSVFLKSGTPKVLWMDEEKIIEYLRNSGHEDLIETKYSINKNEIKNAFSPDPEIGKLVSTEGEAVDGVVVEPGEEKVIVKFNKRDD